MVPVDNFQVYEGKDNQWYWRFVNGGNGAIIAIGGEGFVSKYNAERSIERFKQSMYDIMVFDNEAAGAKMAVNKQNEQHDLMDEALPEEDASEPDRG